MYYTVDPESSNQFTNVLQKESKANSCQEKNPSLRTTWIGRTVDYGVKFVSSYGRGSVLLVFIPTLSLMLSSTKVKNLVITSSFGFAFTVVMQQIWEHFEKINNEKINEELAWRNNNNCKNSSQLPSANSSLLHSSSSALLHSSSSTASLDFPLSRTNSFHSNSFQLIPNIPPLNSDSELESLYKAIETNFKDVPQPQKERLAIQFCLDALAQLINNKNPKDREKQFLVTGKSPQEILEDANSCAQGFKGMALALKISKELIKLGKESNLKLIEEELLKDLHEKYYNAISCSKFNIEVFTIIIEYCCIRSRDDEIKKLKEKFIELRRKRGIVAENAEQNDATGICADAIDISIESIKRRIKYLVEKNISKQREITFDIVEAALTGSQDLFELIKEKTSFFTSFPKLLKSFASVDAGVAVFISVVSFVFNMIKACLSRVKIVNARIDEEYCKTLLKNYREKLRNETMAQGLVSNSNDPKEESNGLIENDKKSLEELKEPTDNYTRFLELKMKVLQKSKDKRFIHIFEKAIKISDDVVTFAASTKLLISAVGISFGSPFIAMLSTAATLVTFLSLGSGLYRFTRKLYSQRHRFVYAQAMLHLKSMRTPYFERLKKATMDFQRSTIIKNNLEKQLAEYKDELTSLIMRFQRERGDRNSCQSNEWQEVELNSIFDNVDKEIGDLFSLSKADEDTYKAIQAQRKTLNKQSLEHAKQWEECQRNYAATDICYEQVISEIDIVRDNLFAKEMAENVDTYDASEVISIRDFLNEELGFSKNGGDVTEQQYASRALWGERLRGLGYYTVKPITAELILKYAFSTMPMTEEAKRNLLHFQHRLDNSRRVSF